MESKVYERNSSSLQGDGNQRKGAGLWHPSGEGIEGAF